MDTRRRALTGDEMLIVKYYIQSKGAKFADVQMELTAHVSHMIEGIWEKDPYKDIEETFKEVDKLFAPLTLEQLIAKKQYTASSYKNVPQAVVAVIKDLLFTKKIGLVVAVIGLLRGVYLLGKDDPIFLGNAVGIFVIVNMLAMVTVVLYKHVKVRNKQISSLNFGTRNLVFVLCILLTCRPLLDYIIIGSFRPIDDVTMFWISLLVPVGFVNLFAAAILRILEQKREHAQQQFPQLF